MSKYPLVVVVILLAGITDLANSQSTWDSSNVGNRMALQDIIMMSRYVGYVVGDTGTIAKTTDGGKTWARQTTGTTIGFLTVAFSDTLHGCAAGGNIMRYTTNGGATWSTPSPNILVGGVKSMAFATWNRGTAVGTGGQTVGSTNGGMSWTAIAAPISQSLYGVAFSDSMTAIAAGNNRMVRSTDGAQTWSLLSIPSAVFSDATSPAAHRVVAVGYKSSPKRGVVYRSSDDGTTWDSVSVTSVLELKAVSFCSRDTGFVLATSGGIYRTVDGGASWDSVAFVPATAGGVSISMIDPRTGVVCGAGGMVYRITIGVTGVAQGPEVPSQLTLDQNFPNPFNPATMIRYSLASRSHVRLTIVTVLGEEVAVLHNGEQEAGHHDVQFDGSGLPSGAYFYRLQTGSHTLTRKCMLLR